MSVPSFVKKPLKTFANYAYKLAKNPSKILLVTGTLGWALSSFAQIIGIITNNKIPKEQKKFLIPQEAADAVFNITSFFLITRGCSALGDALVSKGKLLTPKLREFVKTDAIKAKMAQKDFSGIQNLTELAEKSNKDISDAYYNFADGISFLSSIAGSIVSCNIVTPIARNKFASARQKEAIAKEKANANQESMALAPYLPALPAQNRVTIDDYRSKTTNMPKGQLKI